MIENADEKQAQALQTLNTGKELKLINHLFSKDFSTAEA